MRLWLLCLALFSSVVFAATTKSEALKVVKEIYQEHPFTFYCEKPIEHDQTIFARSCDVCPEREIKIKWMSLIPAKRLAQGKLCQQQPICVNKQGKAFKGVNCCRKLDKLFMAMEADPHVFVPEEPILSQLNNTSSIGIIENPKTAYICDLRHDFRKRTLQPPFQVRGFIARTYLYYHTQYQLDLSSEELNLFKQWHIEHPADAWEIERSAEIYAQTGKLNTWVH